MTEHYVTLFNAAFLPQGLALVASLRRHASPFRLWVLAMDDTVARLLSNVGPDVSVIPLAETETDRHRQVKTGRTVGEWCWTMTSFSLSAVLERATEARRVTYLDADLWLLDQPARLLDQLAATGRGILLTPHHYAPAYDRSGDCGRFCVQFLTVDRQPRAQEALAWWQERCLEWCFNRHEPGRFGDQMYLDHWPRLFGEVVHVVEDPNLFTAPWNHRQVMQRQGRPVFHHFHDYRLLQGGRALWWHRYRLGADAERLYAAYHHEVAEGLAWTRAQGCEPHRFADPARGTPLRWAKGLVRRLRGELRYAEQP